MGPGSRNVLSGPEGRLSKAQAGGVKARVQRMHSASFIPSFPGRAYCVPFLGRAYCVPDTVEQESSPALGNRRPGWS